VQSIVRLADPVRAYQASSPSGPGLFLLWPGPRFTPRSLHKDALVVNYAQRQLFYFNLFPARIFEPCDWLIVMTKPFIPHVLKALTASAACDPANERGAVVSFTADAHYYSFVLDRTALQRLGRQIERVLREVPPLPRKHRGASR